MLNIRASRRGMADLIVMILMIVLLLGVSVLAFMAHDRSRKEEAYLARLREIPASQRAEMDSTKARFAQVSNLIGFKGSADFSSPAAINAMLKLGGNRNGGIIEITGQNIEDKATSTIKGVSGEHTITKLPRVSGTKDKKVGIYDFADGTTVLQAIAAQDFLINELVKNHIPAMQRQVEAQRRWTKESSDKRIADTEEQYSTFRKNRETSNSELSDANQKAIEQEVKATEAAVVEMKLFDDLSGEAILAKVQEKFKAMRDVLPARNAAVERSDEYQKKAGRRMEDDQRDADGYVFLVDSVSGWVWINIGQKSDVRLDMSFQVLRADATTSSLLPIGEIRVKEIVKGNIARCRVDALDDAANFPKQGDIIRNPNFNDRQYYSYCLIGKFGGSSTRMTHQQWTTKLQELGFRVVQTLTGDTDVMVLGENWTTDPLYLKAKDEGLEFEKMSERELMWFLGLDGPESR